MLDVERLCSAFARPNNAEVRDWLGNVWPEGSLPRLPDVETWTSPRVPTAELGDGFRAGGHEWAAFALAAQFALWTGQGTMIEAGASQGPWCLSWVRALSPLWTHRSELKALAIEAGDGVRAAADFWAVQDLEARIERSDKGLSARGPNWLFEWSRAAVVAGGGDVFFPKVDIRQDNGARPERTQLAVDYRGFPVDHERVTGLDLRNLVGQVPHVTFLHCDLQGAEQALLEAGSFQRLEGTTDVVLLGTHSRAAEQLAFELMPTYGFTLMGDSACVMTPAAGGMALLVDGEQVWTSKQATEFYADLHGDAPAEPQGEAEASSEALDRASSRRDQYVVRAAQEHARAEQLSAQLEGILSSRSWRVTEPLRRLHERRSGR